MRKMHDSSNTLCTVCVECTGAGEIGAEWLLDDHVGVLVQAARSEHPYDRPERDGRDREVVQQARMAADRGFRLRDGFEQRLRVVGIRGTEVESRLERLPGLARGLDHAELADRVLGVLAELGG